MVVILVDGGKIDFVSLLTGIGGFGLVQGLTHLFTNNALPDHNSSLATFVEASWVGYGSQQLGGWSNPTIDGLGRGFTQSAPVTFGNTSGTSQICYGYYVTDRLNSGVILAERFPAAPLTIPNLGTLTFALALTDLSQF